MLQTDGLGRWRVSVLPIYRDLRRAKGLRSTEQDLGLPSHALSHRNNEKLPKEILDKVPQSLGVREQ